MGQYVTIPLKNKRDSVALPSCPCAFGGAPITSRGRSLSVKPRSGERSSSSFSLLLFMQDACCLCLARLPSPWGSD